MRLLRLVGPGEDGTSVIVEAVEPGSLDGERFELSLDDRLRTLANSERAKPADPRPEGSGPMPTPREIQVRVRAGETAQAVADEAGIPLERVMRFAYPVLQERVRVTDEARRARARRGGDGLLVPFGELLDSRLGRHGVDPAAVRWDAFRREDGGWTVTAEITSPHERTVLAKFSFALLNRTVSALDDIAADLLSDRPVQALLTPPPAREPVAEEHPEPSAADWSADWDAPTPPPRLTAVPNPGRADAPRPQEASPAVRPPSRRQKAHTRPIPVAADDELFDQNAFDQQPWHEPPLPFEAGAGVGRDTSGGSASGGSPRHQAQQPAADATTRPDAVALAGIAESDTSEVSGLRRLTPAADEAAGVEAPEEAALPELALPELALPEFALPGIEVEQGPADVPQETQPDRGSSNDEPAGGEVAPSRPAQVAAAGDSQRRSRRSGEKPRMPSWDDILLGVRNKTD